MHVTDAQKAVLDAVPGQALSSRMQLLEAVAELLHSRFPHYTGVYLYLLEGDTLLLHTFRGRPTEHARISVGQGICGRAARGMATVAVDDVTLDPDYIACSIETRSEIVVPITLDGRVLGEIDIDSDQPGAFDARDSAFLEALAAKIAPELA